jgi:hypothetical protein
VASQAPHIPQVAFPIKQQLSLLLKPIIKHFSGVQKNDSLIGRDQGHMRDVLQPPSIAAGVLKVWAAVQGWILSCTNITFMITVDDIYSESLASACYTASLCSMHCFIITSFS